ncbi:MAG: response regulator [Synechococcales bacterium]|nr:response regulator [Synechococcales bacterium]
MSIVLLVEDSLTESEILTRYLREAGLFVISAKSSEEAQAQLKKQRPNLIVLDVILPGQSGFEFCHELKANQFTKHIPIIICSTKNTDADKVWGGMLGADAYFPKPVNQEEFLQAVRRLMRRAA